VPNYLPEITAVQANNRRYGTAEFNCHCKSGNRPEGVDPSRSSPGITAVFIVQGKPRGPEGILKVVKATREEAFQAARDLLGGMAFVTIIADSRVYTMEEFALTIDEAQQQFR
jgi:hypothetical protein